MVPSNASGCVTLSKTSDEHCFIIHLHGNNGHCLGIGVLRTGDTTFNHKVYFVLYDRLSIGIIFFDKEFLTKSF
jgi:hypothetical protein